MNCHKVQSMMSAYVDSELSGLEMLAIRQHLRDCDDCKAEFESLYGVKKALGRLGAKQPSSDLATRICMQLDHAEAPRPSLLTELRKHLIFHPARVRLAAAGVGAFAALFMLRAGGLAINSFNAVPAGPALAANGSVNQTGGFYTIPTLVGTTLGTMPVPKKLDEPWSFTENGMTLTSSANGGGFVLTGTGD